VKDRPEQELKGSIFDIKRYAIHDGPGIRTTVFFKGCPLRCTWCHNPESWDSAAQLWYRAGRCIRCGRCVAVCEQHAISLRDEGPVTDVAKCVRCGRCVETCLAGAREIVGRDMTVAAVVDEVAKDTIFYDESGGGVTFSGGEPLMQPEFLVTLLDSCRQLDIHTAVDTTCHADPMVVRTAAERANLFLCDLKHMDPRRHREFTGEDNRLILENIRLLSDMGKEIMIRIPIVPGFNDDQANIKMTGEFAASLGTVIGIDILPYNKGGTEKAKRLMLQSHRITAARVPDHEELMIIADALRSDRFNVKIGG